MAVHRAEQPPFDLDVDLLAIGVTEDLGSLATLDQRFGGRLLPLLERKTFTGKAGSSLSFQSFGAVAAREVMLVGVGDRGAAAIGKAAGKVGRYARETSARTLGCMNWLV